MIYESTHDLNSGYLDNIEVGKEVWAFWFERFGGRSGRIHNKPPMYGKLVGYNSGDTQIRNFIPYKIKNKQITNELAEGKKTWVGKLYFADSYEEAVQAYNGLIEAEMKFYEEKLNILRSSLIK